MPPAAARGISPMSACAPASAASTSSNASTHARAEVDASTGPAATRNRNGSELEEDRLIGALQLDVEAPRAGPVRDREQPPGPSAGGGERRVVLVGWVAGEVDAGDDAVE